MPESVPDAKRISIQMRAYHNKRDSGFHRRAHLSDAEVCLDGKPIQQEKQQVLILFYKPRGIVCSTKKQRQETTVTEFLDYPLRIYPIGRLDKESEGLLLLTNQGDLVNRIIRAGNYHEKEYLVTVNKEVSSEFIQKMAAGVPCSGYSHPKVFSGKNR